MARIIIVVNGGTVTEVLSTDKSIEVDILDYDILDVNEDNKKFMEGLEEEMENNEFFSI